MDSKHAQVTEEHRKLTRTFLNTCWNYHAVGYDHKRNTEAVAQLLADALAAEAEQPSASHFDARKFVESVYYHCGHGQASKTYNPDKIHCSCGEVFQYEGDHFRHAQEARINEAIAKLAAGKREGK